MLTIYLSLSPEERKSKLQACEALINRTKRQFVEAGQALLDIKHEELWRDDYESFEEYCNNKWNYSLNYANRLISSYNTITILEASEVVPTGTDGKKILPTSELQLRPLNKIVNNGNSELAPQAWADALEKAGEQNRVVPTGKLVQQVAEEYFPEAALEDAHPYRVVTYLTPRYRKLLDLALRGEKEADYLRRMVEHCLNNSIKV